VILTLEDCKDAIRKLSVEDRTQLILWLARGMPGEKRPAAPKKRPVSRAEPQWISAKESQSISREESERLALEGTLRHLKDFQFTEVSRPRIELNEPPPPPPPIAG
jgi:hypothetical protein